MFDAKKEMNKTLPQPNILTESEEESISMSEQYSGGSWKSVIGWVREKLGHYAERIPEVLPQPTISVRSCKI